MSESPKEHQQIQRLDDPLKFFWFTQGQAVVFFLMFVLGGMANSAIAGLVAGALLAYWMGAESRVHRAFWRHVIYWYIPGRGGMRCMPESGSRQFLR